MKDSPSRLRPRTLSLFAVLVLVIAGFLYIERPWQSTAGNTVDEGVQEESPIGKQVDEGQPAEGVARIDKEGAASPASSRKVIEAETTLRGRFVATLGSWPGGGRAELRHPAEMPEGGWMGLMNMGLDKARSEIKKAKKGERSEDAGDFFKRMLGRGPAVAGTDVDARGRFVFENPPEGEYVVTLAHPHREVAGETKVQIHTGDKLDIGQVPTRPAASLLVLVSDLEGEPVAGAEVTLRHKIDTSSFMDPKVLENMANIFADFIPTKNHSDERGACRFEGIEFARPWILQVESRNLEPVTRTLMLKPGQETVEQVRLLEGAGIAVQVELPDGRPAPEVRMSLVPVDAPENPPAAMTIGFGGMSQAASIAAIRFRSDESGLATKKGLVPGRYILKSSGPGYLPGNLEVTLERDVLHRMHFRLDAGLAVSGRVLDMAGDPIPDAKVMHSGILGQKVLGVSIGSMVGKDLVALGAGREGIDVDEQGRFTLGGFEKGSKAWLIAVADGYDVCESEGIPAGSEGVELRMAKAVSLQGVVADREGNPIPDFRIRLSQTMWMFIQRDVVRKKFTGTADGSWKISPVARESFTLHIDADGYAPFSKTVRMENGSVDLGELRLQDPGAVEGVTLDPDGRPIGGVVVRIAKGGVQDSLMFAKAMGEKVLESDAKGHFRIDGLSPRRLRLLADKEGYAPGRSKVIKVEEGKTTSGIQLSLTSGGKMDGVVRDREGNPMRGWRIQAGLTSGRFTTYAQVDDEGHFHIDALAPGVYKVDAMPRDFMEKMGASGYDPKGGGDIGAIIQKAQRLVVSERCVVKEGETAQVELVWEDEAREGDTGVDVSGRVSVGGKPLEAGIVSLFKPGQALPAQLVKVRAGAFRIPSADPGHYRLQVQREAMGGLVGSPRQIELPDVRKHELVIDLPGGAIRGIVTIKETGEPAASVVLHLRKARDYSAGMDIVEIGEGTHLTDSKGRFSFEGLAAGTYSILAKELGFAGGKLRGANLSGLTLADGAEMTGLEIQLASGGQLTVQALGPGGAKRNALVTLLDDQGKPMLLFPRSLTDEEGRVRFEGLPKGAYRALVEGPGLAPGVSSRVVVQEGQRQEVRVQLLKGVEVSLLWSGKLPSPMPKGWAFYSVWDDKGVLVRRGRMPLPADPAKEVQFGQFLPGKYRLFLQHLSLGVYQGEHDLPNQTRAVWKLKL